MKIFTLRFLATTGFVSDAIKFVEGAGAHADHVEAKNRTGDGWIGAHAGVGVVDRPLDWAKGLIWERQYELQMTDEQYDAAMGFLESKLGTPYDYSNIVGIMFRDVKLEDRDRVICSVLQYEAIWTGGIRLLNVLPQFAHLVTPDSLHLSPILIAHCSYDWH